MNTSPTLSPNVESTDEDLSEQAHPGHGVPSQDPSSKAQFPLEPAEAERESHSVLMGGGVITGMAAGAAVGVAVSGPVGVVVGGALGAVAGALGSAAAGTLVTPESVGAVPAPRDEAGTGTPSTVARDARGSA